MILRRSQRLGMGVTQFEYHFGLRCSGRGSGWSCGTDGHLEAFWGCGMDGHGFETERR